MRKGRARSKSRRTPKALWGARRGDEPTRQFKSRWEAELWIIERNADLWPDELQYELVTRNSHQPGPWQPAPK